MQYLGKVSCFCFEFLIFTVFIDFFSYLGLSHFLRWKSDHFQIKFLWFLRGKWTILRLFYSRMCCAKMYIFWVIALFYHFMGHSTFLRWNSNHFQIEFLWFPWGKCTILRLFYQGVYRAKMCISEILLLFLFV